MAKPSIKKNYIYNTLYEMLAIITPLITAPYVSRIFQADGVGIYSRTENMAAYFVMFSALGIRGYGQREIAQHRDNKQEVSKLFWELELMCISTTLVCLVIWAALIGFSNVYAPYYAVLTMTVAATAFDISWFWSGHEQYRFIVIRNSLIKIIGIILLFTFVHEKSDLLLYISLIAITGLLGNLSMWTYLPKYLVKVNIRSLEVKRHYKETLVYFVPSIATSIYTKLDKLMIGWITHDDFENGYYEQATKIINICKTLVLSINTVVSSRMSYLFAQNKHDEIRAKLKSTLNFVLLIATPITFGLIGIAVNFVPFFFGEGYDNVVQILYIMAPLMMVIGISNCFGALYFTPSGQRARSNKGIVTGAIVNLVLNLITIYFLKAFGAALASVIAELTITAMYLYMARDYFDIKCIPGMMWKRLIAAGVMLAVVAAFRSLPVKGIWLIVLQIGGGALVYGLTLLLMRDHFLIDNAGKILKKVLRRK